MASLLNPYLSYDGDARQAMEFYKEVFGGTLSLHTFGELGGQAEGIDGDKIMHGMLQTPSGFTLMGADNPPGMEYKAGTNFSVSLSGEDDAELRAYWEKLSADGNVAVPLDKQMWGDVFGMCTDKFGVPWMVNISEPQG
ncbi:VOC family protein [Streptomyces sp. B-S-A8]|uniref:VOC family protein n=1 Tax=Streptomyces solicavernae TaxID=3043614 RepID=A0ABT6RW86_9ACTN|nr:VOC family protein [Streptomyces sp. B-S-A8]MDI3388711.1 VOC family protein [Streptomyces sp. B-S-A8]